MITFVDGLNYIKLMDKAEIMKDKARGYVVCYNSNCPQREHCLRWIVGKYVDKNQRIVTCVNPMRIYSTRGKCQDYRDDKPVKIPKGMISFYEKMPGKLEREIKSCFISRFTRVGYYDLRNGKKQITPQIEQEMVAICVEHGWTEPLVFDEYVEELLW